MEEIEGAEHQAIWTAVGLILIVAVTTILIAGAYNLRKGMQGENLYHAHQLGLSMETLAGLSANSVASLYPDDLTKYLIQQQRNMLRVEEREHKTASYGSYQLVLPRTGVRGEHKQFDSPKALLMTKIHDQVGVQEVDPQNIPTLEELEKSGDPLASKKIKRGEEASAYG